MNDKVQLDLAKAPPSATGDSPASALRLTPGGTRADGERRGADAERRDGVAEARDGVADERDVDGELRDADAGRRDDIADERDEIADARDDVADGRDVDGGLRDADAERRDASAALRDLTGDRRDDEGVTRDLAADGRDESASQRDHDADQRDRASDQRDLAAEKMSGSYRHGGDEFARAESARRRREQAASDRQFARDDRRAAAVERTDAARDRAIAFADRIAGADRRGGSRLDRGTAVTDRGIALADRVAGASGRGSSGLDRNTALADRGIALADRVAGASGRGSSVLDRGTAFDDRVASAVDRRSALEYAALELKMAESEARAWRLLQALPDSVVVVNADGIIELINAQAVLLFGYQPDELIGQPVERLIPAGLHEAHRAHRASYVAAEEPQRMSTGADIVAVRKDGTTVPVEVTLSAITLSTGRAVLASVRDVSDRKLADAELRISDERFRVSFDSALIGMALIDLHRESAGRFLRVNAALCELTGYSEMELLATTSPAITHPDDQGETVTNIERLADGALTRWNTEKRYRSASSGDVWVHFDISVVHDAAGGPSYGVTQVEDITDRKRAEAQIEERFHELATNVDVGFLVRQLDPPEYLYCNPAYLTVFGFDPAGPMPGPDDRMALVSSEDVDRVKSIMAGPAPDRPIEQEWRFTRPDGELRWVSGRASPITDDDGQIRRVAGLFEDITGRKNAEIAVLDARAEAERANAAKAEFLSRLSHELRTPLNAVLGFAQLLELDALSDTQGEAVEHILRGGRHLLTMIDDILDITGIDADRVELSPEPVGVLELLHDAVGMMAPLAAASKITLHFDAAQPAGQHYIRADRRRLKQVLINLLSNAIKYNHPGGRVEITVTIDEQDRDQLSIAVIDTGMGIPAADLPRLFNPFDRLGRQSSGIEGTGIGLVLAQRLTMLMGGRMDVETTEGRGSAFSVTLPLAEAPTSIGLDSDSSDSNGSASIDGAAWSTLVYIEDNPSNINLLTSIMRRRRDWTMSHASTGAAGLELAIATIPTVILLDLHLPDLDGIDVLRALKADPRTANIPVAVLSADAGPTQIARLLAVGAQSYLTKPLYIRELFEFLDSHASDRTPPIPTQ